MSKISIIIPCYNAGEHLAEAVQSALAQTWPSVEVIIVDDGSTDAATLQLLRESSWPRTRVFHQPNAGPAAARNRAIREATGEYILPLDADDIIEPTYVAKAAAVLDAQPEVGIVYCKATKFGAEQGPWELPHFSGDELALGNVIFVSALFRKADWAAVDGFDERLRYGMEDYDFWIKLVHAGRKVVQLDDFLFRCRVSAQSRTSAFEQDREQVVATYAEIFRAHRDFFADHAESLFRHRFALRARLERESKDAKFELDGLKASKQEADRYNASLLASKREADRYNASLRSELERARVSQARMQHRFRALRFLWPRDDGEPGKPE